MFAKGLMMASKDSTLKNSLGAGAYTVSDIAYLLGLPQAKVSRYLSKYWDSPIGKEIFKDTVSWRVGKRRVVNFYVLIEFRVLFLLLDEGLNVREIAKARAHIKEHSQIEYPFANHSVLHDGKKIFYELGDAILRADGKRQTEIKQIILHYCEKIEFDENGLAKRFWPAGKGSCLVVDPHHQFGQPTICDTNIKADVIFELYKAGDTIDLLSDIYSVPISALNDIIAFYQARIAA